MSARTGALIARHLRAGSGAAVVIALVVALLAAIAVMTPRAVASLLDDSTRYRIGQLSAPVRDLTASTSTAPFPGAAPPSGSVSDAVPPEFVDDWGSWDAGLASAMAAASGSLGDFYDSAGYFVRLGAPAQYSAMTWVLLDPAYASRIRLTEGRLPESTADQVDWMRAMGFDPATGQALAQPGAIPTTEIVLSADAAKTVGWAVGETREIGQGAGWARFGDGAHTAPLTLVGVFEAVDPDDPYWARAADVLRATVAYNPDGGEYIRTAAYASPVQLDTLPQVTAALTTAWFPLRAETVDASSAPHLLAALSAFTSSTVSVGASSSPISLRFQSGVVPTLERAVAQNHGLTAVLALLAAGPVGAALAALLLGCRMIAERRRTALSLLTARGASRWQRGLLLAIEGLLAGLLPAAVGAGAGWLLGRVLWPGTSGDPSVGQFVVPLVIGLLPAAVLALSGPRRRERADEAKPSRWRLVAEGVLLVIAALATTLLIVRGAQSDDGGLEPLAAAAPALLAIVAGLVALRLVPPALRGILARRRTGTGYVGLLGAARALRDPVAGFAPVFALLVGVSFAVASGILLSVLQHGADDAARASVGADIALSSAHFDDGAAERVEAVPGVADVASFSTYNSALLMVGTSQNRVDLTIVDTTALARVQEGYPSVLDGVDLGDGSGDPRLLFSALTATRTRAAQGDDLSVLGVPARFAGSSVMPAPFAPTSAWVLADAAYADRFADEYAPTTTILVRLDADASADQVVQVLRDELGPGMRATTVGERLADLRTDPIWPGLRLALTVGVVLSAALGAIAVVMTLVLGAPARRRLLALLQTLGAPPRAAGRLVAWELAPAGVAALLIGTAFGAALPFLVIAVVDLRPFTGGPIAPAYTVEPGILALSVGGFLVASIGVAAAALALTRRTRAAAVLRTVEET